MTARDLNLMRVFFFIVGFITGILAYRAVAFITPVIPHAQLLHNDCPRVNGAGGSKWCTGPGAPR